MFKLDFLKTFDRLSWEFFNSLLHEFGFGLRWGNWLKTCWNTTSFSIFLMDPQVRNFCGLHQGDSISPMIFVLASEFLIQLFLKAQSLGEVHAFCASRHGVQVPILQMKISFLLMGMWRELLR